MKIWVHAAHRIPAVNALAARFEQHFGLRALADEQLPEPQREALLADAASPYQQ